MNATVTLVSTMERLLINQKALTAAAQKDLLDLFLLMEKL